MNNNVSSKKQLKISFLVLTVLALLSLALAVFTSLYAVKKDYAWENEEGEVSALSFEHTYENVFFDESTGVYEPQNDDPWIMMSKINDSYTGVLVKLSDYNDKKVEVKAYWTKVNEPVFSESRTRTSIISAGANTAYIRLPKYPIDILRLDISEDCTISKITLSKGKVNSTSYMGSTFYIFCILRFIIIYAVMITAALYHKERVLNGQKLVKGFFVDEHKKDGYLYEYDYIRTLAALLVIMMHSVIENFAPAVAMGEPGYLTLKTVLALSTSCNVLYVMLSGALLLAPKEESIKDFYVKRLGRVLIPTISYYLLYELVGFRAEVFDRGFLGGIKEIGLGLLTGRPTHMLHMWFIYAILGLYIIAPFMRIAISKISEECLFGLIIAGFIFNVFTTYLPIWGIKFGIDTPIAGWVGVFLLGYYMTTEHAAKKWALFMSLGIAGIVMTCVMIYLRPDLLFYFSNQTPLEWLAGAGIFAFFTHFKKLFSKGNFIISSISKYNFSIMLVHVLLLMKFILPVGWRLENEYGHLRVSILGMILVCFVLSYLLSVFYDNTAIACANYIYKKIINKRRDRSTY